MSLEINEAIYYPDKSKTYDPKFVWGALWICILGFLIMSWLLPNNKIVNPYEKVGLVINGSIIDTKTPPIIENEAPLVSLNDIKKYIDKYIFFDQKNNKVIITTSNRVIRIKVNENKGSINNKPLILNSKVQMKNGVVYIPLKEFEDIYGIDIAYIKGNNVVVVDTKEIVYNTGIAKYKNVGVRKKPDPKLDVIEKLDKGEQFEIIGANEEWYKIYTKNGTEGFIQKKYGEIDTSQIKSCTVKYNNRVIRKMPSIKQPIYKKVNKNEQLKIYGEVDDWYKVRTNDGIVGFIAKSEVTNEVVKTKAVDTQPDTRWKPKNGKINLVWEQIENVTPVMDNVDRVDGLDIVSPTWFEIISEDGKIRNKVDEAYIRWARANGYKIWGLVSNGVNTDKTEMTSIFLSNSNTREKIINELVFLSQLYGLDGINVDFEYVAVKDKDLLTQFMRELYPICKDKGLVLSVDVTVKVDSPNSLCFDRKELAKACDYVIVMTYDQYWATSPVSGSVAEYSWVDKNIKMLLKEIPKEKFIMGIPFYVRQWKEVAGSKPVSASISMAKAKNIIRQYGAKVVWDKNSGQYYAEFYKDKAKYKLWLEDARSINLKSSLVLKYDLAGVASWRRGYETPDIWGVLNKNLKEIKTYEEWKKVNKDI